MVYQYKNIGYSFLIIITSLVACKEGKSNPNPLPKEDDKSVVIQKTKEVKSLANLLIHEVVNTTYI